MATSLEQTRQTVDAYARAQGRITSALLRVLMALWSRFPEGGDRDMERAWAARSAVDVDIALGSVRRLARGYMLTRLAQIDAPVTRLPEIVETYERGGTPIVEVYQRPARQKRYVERVEQARGSDPEVVRRLAEEAQAERLTRIVEADVQATARDEVQKVLEASPKVIGYRRIIHPEMSKTGTCGLCIVAADRLYSIAELMEIHDGCKCTVDAVTADADPGLSLNREDLDRLYAAAGGEDGPTTAGDALKNIRITSYEHGELGPILIRKGSKFRSVADVNADTKVGRKATPFKRQNRQDDQTNWRAMVATSERSIRYLQNARSRGTDMVDLGTGRATRVRDFDQAIQFHRDLIARARRHAA